MNLARKCKTSEYFTTQDLKYSLREHVMNILDATTGKHKLYICSYLYGTQYKGKIVIDVNGNSQNRTVL